MPRRFQRGSLNIIDRRRTYLKFEISLFVRVNEFGMVFVFIFFFHSINILCGGRIGGTKQIGLNVAMEFPNLLARSFPTIKSSSFSFPISPIFFFFELSLKNPRVQKYSKNFRAHVVYLFMNFFLRKIANVRFRRPFLRTYLNSKQLKLIYL